MGFPFIGNQKLSTVVTIIITDFVMYLVSKPMK